MKIAREKICLYSSMYPGVSSAEMIINCAEKFEVGGVELMNFCQELPTPDREVARRLGGWTNLAMAAHYDHAERLGELRDAIGRMST